MLVELSRMARPRAAPSVGSVPAPSSSSRTRLLASAAVKDGGDARNVRAERAERLFQALLVADVGEDVMENRHVAALAGRDVHARLGHQAEQARRFETDRFAAGVRAGDDEQVEAETQANIDGTTSLSRVGRGGGSRASSAPVDARPAWRKRCSSNGCRACRSQVGRRC